MKLYFKIGQIHLVNLVLGGLFIPSITSWLAAPALWLERVVLIKVGTRVANPLPPAKTDPQNFKLI